MLVVVVCSAILRLLFTNEKQWLIEIYDIGNGLAVIIDLAVPHQI